ncbi:MAG TPA: ubiquinone/menaquinone biosynthesis methyltransferase [Vicinamibacterales bacterium]|nr:ubiquinone/menaquinone biosynthesis methyltransferase [Vicinamibacterales bacterium]
MSLREALSSPDRKARYVRRLFGTIADRYDLITVLLSYGRDRAWKRRLGEMADVRPGVRALDLACGTGDITLDLARRGARAIGLDITPRMIALARKKAGSLDGPAVDGFLVGDMMALPCPDAAFDLVTSGYGLRNVPDLDGALDEIRRVLKPGGRFVSLDFDRPPGWLLRTTYLTYLTIVGSLVGLVLHGDPDTYRYIAESLRRYPGAAAVADQLRARGFTDVRHLPVLGGLMAIHVGRVGQPASPPPAGASVPR